MKRLLPLTLLAALAVPAIAQLQAPGPDNSIKVGEMAPDFAIPAAQRGQPATNLSDLLKGKNALIMFFPGAFTPGCTTEFTQADRKSTRLNSSHVSESRMPSSA